MGNWSGRQQATRIVGGIGGLLIVAMIVGVLVAVLALREREIEDWQRQMSNMSLLLAEQTSQTVFCCLSGARFGDRTCPRHRG